jgi:hypothetical protein
MVGMLSNYFQAFKNKKRLMIMVSWGKGNLDIVFLLVIDLSHWFITQNKNKEKNPTLDTLKPS